MSEFHLRDTLASAEFSGRLADVFAGLGSGQVKADKEDLKRMNETRPNFDKQQMERSGHFHDKVKMKDVDEVVEFKRPKLEKKDVGRSGKRGRGGKMPGFKRNPEGYTKYSLADVPELSDRSNSAAAFDFLRKLKEGKEESEKEEPADLSQKIVFKKRGFKSKEIRAAKDTQDEKNISEENILHSGSGNSNEKQIKSSKSKAKSNQLTLSHLDEEEDE